MKLTNNELDMLSLLGMWRAVGVQRRDAYVAIPFQYKTDFWT